MRRHRVLFAVGVAVLSCSQTREHEGISRSNIYNASPPATTAEQNGIAFLDIVSTGSFANGSAVALSNRTFLTAAHVLRRAKSQADYSNVTVTMGAQKNFTAQPIPMFPDQLSLATNLDIQTFRVSPPAVINGVSSGYHRIFSPVTIADLPDQPVTCMGYGLGGNPPGSVQAMGTLRTADFTARTGSAVVPERGNQAATSPDFFFFDRNNQNEIVAPGDSGGPCFDSNGELIGITIGAGPRTLDANKKLVLPSFGAAAFMQGRPGIERLLAFRASDNLLIGGDGDFDFDGTLDTAALVAKANGIGGTCLDIQIQFGNDPFFADVNGQVDFDDVNLLDVCIPPPATVAAATLERAAAAVGPVSPVPFTAGDFNGDQVSDVLSFFGDLPFYYDGTAAFLPVVHLDVSQPCLSSGDCRLFTPLRTDYVELRSSDLNADGFDDVEAFAPGIPDPDVYYGSPHGLTTGFEFIGFPTGDGGDGKFASVTTQLPSSVGIPDYTFSIFTQHAASETSPELHLELFDGDLFGSHDVVSANVDSVVTCIKLYADPQLSEVQSGSPLVTLNDAQLSNDSWQSLLQQEDPAAEVLGVPGTFAYVLRVYLSTTSCDQEPAYPTDPLANSFKVRVNGDVALVSTQDPLIGLAGAFSILGSDSDGDFVGADDCTLDSCATEFAQDVNTTYDGDWHFWVDMTGGTGAASILDQVTLADADADSPLDLVSPGQSIGASPDTNFTAEDGFSSSILFQPPFPSGQYDPDLEPCVAYSVTNGGALLPAFVDWHWSSLFTHNNVWLAIPTNAPPQCVEAPAARARLAAAAASTDAVAAFLIRGAKPRKRIPLTTASVRDFWASAAAADDIAAVLPITLGTDTCGEPALVVHSTGQAQQLLDKPNGSDPHERLMTALRAELLTAKLNILRGQSHGEHIERGWIYGTVQDIRGLIEAADAAVSHSNGQAHGHDERCGEAPSNADLAMLIRLLGALNNGSVTYRAPITGSSSSGARGLTARPLAAPSMSNFLTRF